MQVPHVPDEWYTACGQAPPESQEEAVAAAAAALADAASSGAAAAPAAAALTGVLGSLSPASSLSHHHHVAGRCGSCSGHTASCGCWARRQTQRSRQLQRTDWMAASSSSRQEGSHMNQRSRQSSSQQWTSRMAQQQSSRSSSLGRWHYLSSPRWFIQVRDSAANQHCRWHHCPRAADAWHPQMLLDAVAAFHCCWRCNCLPRLHLLAPTATQAWCL